jgi:DSP-PTPase phosphatase fused to NAD+ Kinase
VDIDTRQFVHALEDLPDEVRDQAAQIAGTQRGLSLRQRVEDDCATAVLDGFGTLEQAPLLHFLSRYPVTAYTYRVSAEVSRGQRPDAAKLAVLSASGHGATINLCAEMDGGDAPAIVAAGLGAVLRTHHVPVTDMEPPTVQQLTVILDLLAVPGAEPTYVHCEAGKGRTGVVIACYRMAVMGWDAADALVEAANFGCSTPGQLAFIRGFGDTLAGGLLGAAVGRYPLLPLGAVRATPEQLLATVRSVAAAELAAGS